ncbi:hypothetical protein AMAG_18233 [Allomyces macrogynus ATCC 38327]|uniref:Uncharacterized protein n=1 Tax=Allomyces macrogynus (strain ATCC 38327) TaxID=578462 RepID=A0A0L0S776_ALLM3|nr:hypothetical protein AMAG_18233 [Allomyces macrogynus ATCC 38327]|eukprot:KNE58372.1 hypothetical protein AMAG_18233 [Allomyces macrogynus ATCC 38327]
MASANLTWATGDQSAYTSTAHASFVNHTGDPTRRTAATEYELNKAKNPAPVRLGRGWRPRPPHSSYKMTFATSSSTYTKGPRPFSRPTPPAGRAGGSPPRARGRGRRRLSPSRAAPGFDILTGTAVAAQRAPGTFFAGRVSMQKLEAKAHARQPGWNIITGSFGG